MFVLAVTGGVACGKSLFADVFAGLAENNIERFDCDHSVHALLMEPDILAEIRSRFGSGVFDNDGALDRHHMREAGVCF